MTHTLESRDKNYIICYKKKTSLISEILFSSEEKCVWKRRKFNVGSVDRIILVIKSTRERCKTVGVVVCERFLFLWRRYLREEPLQCLRQLKIDKTNRMTKTNFFFLETSWKCLKRNFLFWKAYVAAECTTVKQGYFAEVNLRRKRFSFLTIIANLLAKSYNQTRNKLASDSGGRWTGEWCNVTTWRKFGPR